MTPLEQMQKALVDHPDWGRVRLQKLLAWGRKKTTWWMAKAKASKDATPTPPSVVEGPATPKTPPTAKEIADMMLRLLQSKPMTPAALAEAIGCSLSDIHPAVESISKSHDISYSGAFIQLTKPCFGRIPVELIDGTDWYKCGLIADTHLGCREERLDACHAAYDLFQREGIKDVFHAGNIVDGYIEKINGASAIATTIDDQAQYVVDNYPRRDGITTNFITGDDHEGWWIQKGFNFGKFLEMLAREQGRTDLKYIGHVEADVELKRPGRPGTVMKIQHPGGGSSYARSYTAQKQIESFQGGEKPQILVQGHYHVSNYMNDRNVHVIGMPGMQDQTIFARKKRLRMEVGCAILEFKQSPNDNSVARLRIEFTMLFDRGYYRKFLRSDAKLLKGHLVVGLK